MAEVASHGGKVAIVVSEYDRVGVALDALTQGIEPYFRQELESFYGPGWEDRARQALRNDRLPTAARTEQLTWDAHGLLSVMWELWNEVFRRKLGLMERSLVGELREFRNRWAHQSNFTEDDAYRALDSAQRLLTAVRATQQVERLEREKLDLLRQKFGRRVNDDLRRARFNRERMSDVLLYTVCCIAINISVFMLFGPRNLLSASLMAGFVLFTFGFLIFKRINAAAPVYGVHECQHCRKIIYTEICPYCEPQRRTPEPTTAAP